ncbi:transposase, partial [Mycobacterium simulans]|uniref:transposase n=1 Tax=Mycobacterium simulans TaxID=627089 RepID=UPI0021E5260B
MDDQIDQARCCLTLVTNAAVLWTTTYLGDALDALHTEDLDISDEAVAHLTPARRPPRRCRPTTRPRRRARR